MSEIRENKEVLNHLFQELGQAIVPALPLHWERVVAGFFIEAESGITHFQLFFLEGKADDYVDVVKESWDTDRYDDAIVDSEDICRKMHTVCAEAGDDWSSMTFMVEKNGNYHTDFSYEAIDSYDMHYVLVWQSRYLI